MKKSIKVSSGELQFLATHYPLLASLKMPLIMKSAIRKTSRSVLEINKDLNEEIKLATPEAITKLQEKLTSGERLSDKKQTEIQEEITKLSSEWEKSEEFQKQFNEAKHEIDVTTILATDIPKNFYMRDTGVGTLITPNVKFKDDKEETNGVKRTAMQKHQGWVDEMCNQLETALDYIID